MHADNHPTTEPRPNDRFSFFWPVSRGVVGGALLRAPASQSLIDRGSAASTRLDAPFQRVPVALFTSDGHVLVGNTGSREFSRFRYGPRMIAAGRIALDLPAVPVTRRDRRAWLDSVRTRLAQDRERSSLDPAAKASFVERHERLLDGAIFPPTRPYYAMAALDERNDLWLQLPASVGGRSRWQVRAGARGGCCAPSSFRPATRSRRPRRVEARCTWSRSIRSRRARHPVRSSGPTRASPLIDPAISGRRRALSRVDRERARCV